MLNFLRFRPIARRLAAMVFVAFWLAGLSACSIRVATARAAGGAASEESGSEQVTALSDEVGNLTTKLESSETSFERLLYPVGILVSILAAGGTLGIVFSFRDQRRASQIHELTVAGELSSQKRTEQSYSSFLEQSQTTLSLVNDTLELAKQANDRAMQNMKSKAESEAKAVDERSRALMNDAFRLEEFGLIVEDDDHRRELHSIAEEARLLEGYLRLQDITFDRSTKFIRSLDRFLTDDTEGAIKALTLSVGDGQLGELQRFEEYWLGSMLAAVGDYGDALNRFKHDQDGLSEDHPEYFQLGRVLAETEFFVIAKRNAEAESARREKGSGQVSELSDTRPGMRREAVKLVLADLEALAGEVRSDSAHRLRDEKDRRHHALLDIARTRADIHEWIAYDRGHLDDSLKESKKDAKSKTAKEDFEVRTEALEAAKQICEEVEEKDRKLDLNFALAESLFKLGEKKMARKAFESAAANLDHEFQVLHEKRRSASLRQSLLICQVRLLGLVEAKERSSQRLQVDKALRDAAQEVKDMRQRRVTVFSQVQRRNISQSDFADELQEIVSKHPLMGKRA